MRLATAVMVLSTLAAAAPAAAQSRTSGPTMGQYQVKAFQAIPKAKTAVQLTSDSHLSRELRKQVMIRLSQRGNEVGFSGGNVMRMDVQFIDLSEDRSRGTGAGDTLAPDRERPDDPPPTMPNRPMLQRPATPPVASATLRVTLTLYGATAGKVLWTATAACATHPADALDTGQSMINVIFDNANRNGIGGAGCPA